MRHKRLLSSLVVLVFVLATAVASPVRPATAAKPTQLQILGNQIAVSARNDFLTQLAKTSSRSANLDYIVDPLFSASLKNEVMVDSALSANFWAKVRPINQKVKIYMAPTENMKFLLETMWPTLDTNAKFGNWLQVKIDRARVEQGTFGGGAPGFDIYGNHVFMMFTSNNMSQGNGFWTSSTSHEFTHVIQRHIMHGNFAPLYGWMLEGQADYIGANIATRNSDTAYASYWAQLIKSVEKNSSRPEMLDWNSKQFVDWFQQQEVTQAPSEKYKGDIPTEAYVFGALALQYLYGTYGFDAVTKLYKNKASIAISACPSADSTINPGCTPARHKAFEHAFGISLASFYEKVAPFIVQEIAWSKVTVEKLPSDLLKIAPAPWVATPIRKPFVSLPR